MQFGGTSGLSIQQLSRKSGLLVIFTPMSELRDFIVRRVCPSRTDKLKRAPAASDSQWRQTSLRGIPVFRGIFRAHDLLVFRATGRTFPRHAMTRFQGGERGCTGQQFENATPGNCYHSPAGAAFLCSTKVCA